ncbi:VIT domain-containing protein [Taklimakanibacter lacteus]|uniref:VIT domain-containing protein n=1 Tax=Taklimakanibacter lacteus TaxID=2268456 RepID=UPI000E66B906
MPTANPALLRDPLQIFLEKRATPSAQRPVPLVSTDFAVTIEGGLAIVTTTRVFRNEEESPIEATLTFPMPVHATLFDLKVRVGERELTAKAHARDRARAVYEDAIDRGKSTVLHEEVLRGIHMLSVANIPAGAEIEVRTQWVTTLTVISSAGHLRIPVTVGDVYGSSPLAESDDIKIGGRTLSGTLEIHASADARIRLVGGSLEAGKARLLLNRPIDLVVENWRPGVVEGIAADGRVVHLTLQPAPEREAPLDLAILVDHSGSMKDLVRSWARPSTKHEHVLAALRRLAARLSPEDTTDLWEFDDHVRHLGSGKLGGLVDGLSPPAGGTEIGRALATSIAGSSAGDILLITDGKSHALDVQDLARRGRRISVVLVGEDSLEANVGYLAALTGGDIFVSGGADIGDLLEAALGSVKGGGGALSEKDFRRSGMMVKVSHGASPSGAEQTLQKRAVAAAAASFLLPTLTKDVAMALAEREGIVSHLTSLVLVDEAGATQETLPGQRPVALPLPAACSPAPMDIFDAAPSSRRFARRASGALQPEGSVVKRLRKAVQNFTSQIRPPAIDSARQIDWASDPARLIAGDLSQLPATVGEILLEMAQRDSVKRSAAMLGLTPLLLVIALLARQAGRAGNRAAARVAHRLLGQCDEVLIEKHAHCLEA